MIRNYFKIAWRNIHKNKSSSIINIGGLSVGMAVVLLIGLWIHNELSFDKDYKNYDRIVQVWQHISYNSKISSQSANPSVMSEAIRNEYGSDFKYVVQASWDRDHVLNYNNKVYTKTGNYFEPEVTEMLDLNMLHGDKDGLKKINSILLSQSVAQTLFGTDNPIGKILKLDNRVDVEVTGVYEDLPEGTSFNAMKFILTWKLYLNQNEWVKNMSHPWGSNNSQTFAQLSDNVVLEDVSHKIRNIKLEKISEGDKRFNPQVFLHPMSKWRLFSKFENGVNTGGRIENVWSFGIIGLFVLLLACINFINLSTAQSEKRAKEVGIRKSIGSKRIQLIIQFFSESLLIALFSFIVSIVLVVLILPFFNRIAESNIGVLWNNPLFWITGIGLSLFTGTLAGIYPAIYLSSFKPIKVLKGTIQFGRFASLPRKVLVVFQFSISVILIIGTIIVYEQINYAQDRPLGYDKNGLVSVNSTYERNKQLSVIRSTLINDDAIIDLTESFAPVTAVWNTNGNISWDGKDPNFAVDFPNTAVNYEFGKTIGWKVKDGRDFSRDFGTDSLAFIINEAAVEFMEMEEPVGKTMYWGRQPVTIIGVVEDLMVQSPYNQVRPSIYHLSTGANNVITLRLNPTKSTKESLSKIESVFKTHNPGLPVNISFVDEEYAKKFGNEKRIGELTLFFTILAIFISCLGIFGLALYVAERRKKEIGIRKVLGASILYLWKMLSKDFVVLVIIACTISIPIAYFIMNGWLQKFEYRTSISWWIFGITFLGTICITLFTVSFQAIKAAISNPIKSLQTE